VIFPLAHARLYGILDLAYVPSAEAERVIGELLAGGVDIVQLRGKNCEVAHLDELVRVLSPIAAASGVPFVINDHAEIAARHPLVGVHVGQDDATVAEVRAQVGRDVIIGKSTHSVSQAVAAAEEGADYIGFGPLFRTPTKPDYAAIGLQDIRAVHAKVDIPIFCIGGIKLENLEAVINAGAERVVIVSGLLQAPEVMEAARRVKNMLAGAESTSRSLARSKPIAA